MRISGIPSPGRSCGAFGGACWFSAVSDIDTVETSYANTRRDFHKHSGVAPLCDAAAVSRAAVVKNFSGSGFRAWQYAPVFAEQGFNPTLDTVRDQHITRRLARMVGAEHLPQETAASPAACRCGQSKYFR